MVFCEEGGWGSDVVTLRDARVVVNGMEIPARQGGVSASLPSGPTGSWEISIRLTSDAPNLVPLVGTTVELHVRCRDGVLSPKNPEWTPTNAFLRLVGDVAVFCGVEVEYRELLIKYIYHVMDREGVSFLDDANQSRRRFSEAEWAELQRLDDVANERLAAE